MTFPLTTQEIHWYGGFSFTYLLVQMLFSDQMNDWSINIRLILSSLCFKSIISISLYAIYGGCVFLITHCFRNNCENICTSLCKSNHTFFNMDINESILVLQRYKKENNDKMLSRKFNSSQSLNGLDNSR